LPAAGRDAGDRVKAEVVVGADGLARAIRFLN
jgi:flavin-dependent dehydrogenase